MPTTAPNAPAEIIIGKLKFSRILPRGKVPTIEAPTGESFYRPSSQGVTLFDNSGLPRVFIKRGYCPFPVTCHRVDDGRIRYMFGLSSIEAAWLFGDPKISVMASHQVAKDVVETVFG